MNFFTFFAGLNWSYQSISAFSSAVVYLILILFVLTKAGKHPAAKMLLLSYICIMLWVFNFWFLTVATNARDALRFGRIFEIGAIFTCPVYTHSLAKLVRMKISGRILRVTYFLACVCAAADLFTPYFIKDVTYHAYWYSNYFIDPGPLYYIFFAYASFLFVYATYSLYRHGRQNTAYKTQTRYLMFGTLFASAGGLLYFINIFGWHMPGPLMGMQDLPHDAFTILLPVITAYNIIHNRFMEIDTVIHKTVMWFLTILILIMPVGLLHGLLKGWMYNLSLGSIVAIDCVLFLVFLSYYHNLKPRIDHLFRRRKYDYYMTLAGIGQKIGSELDIDKIVTRLFHELREVLYVRNAMIMAQQPGEENYTQIGVVNYAQVGKNGDKAMLQYSDALGRQMTSNKRALERRQIEVDQQYDASRQEFLEWFSKYNIEVLIPVVVEDRVNGLIGMGKKESLQGYTSFDLELLEKMGRQLGIIIDNALHHADIVEKERLAEELKLGREIQSNLLPKEVPITEGLQMYGLMIPAKEIGGDYYDFITGSKTEQQKVMNIVIGDVSGKGVGAGLIMATAKATLKGLCQRGMTSKEILQQANDLLYEYMKGERFMTMLFMQWDCASRRLSYSSAGHERILIYRAASGQVEIVVSGGFMLGMLPSIGQFLEDRSLPVAAGDKIILYTDGVTEAKNQDNRLFTLGRLIEAVARNGRLPANQLLDSIRQEVYNFIGDREQYDDITLVVLEAE